MYANSGVYIISNILVWMRLNRKLLKSVIRSTSGSVVSDQLTSRIYSDNDWRTFKINGYSVIRFETISFNSETQFETIGFKQFRLA